jgi:hypothetical protein
MQKPKIAPKQPSRPRTAWWIGGAVAALGIAFGAGRLTSAPAPARARPEPVQAQARAYEPPAPPRTAWSLPSAPAGDPQLAATLAAPAAPAPSSRASIPPAQMAQYRAEVVSHVEEQRQRLVSTCWPKEGLPRGSRSTTVTYNVTFNPQGREVGRGIVQDRRAPAGKFGTCLQLQGKPFSISPPGTYVSLRIPVTYP